MPLEIIIPIAAVIILLLLFNLSIKVFTSTIKTLLIIVAILLLLQIAFGVSSGEILQEMKQIVAKIQQLIVGN